MLCRRVYVWLRGGGVVLIPRNLEPCHYYYYYYYPLTACFFINFLLLSFVLFNLFLDFFMNPTMA